MIVVAAETGTVRQGDAKGKHTTVRRELIPLPWAAGALIDTPGLRSVGLVSSEFGLQQAFSDIEELAEQCRFHDCVHLSEPGCAVIEHVDDRRVTSYRKLLRENAWATKRRDLGAHQQRLQDAKRLTKVQRKQHRGRR